MTRLTDIAKKIRSKNAGPFWLTFDVFFDDADTFRRASEALPPERVADLLNADLEHVKRFEIPDLNVLKFSLPRPHIQGTRQDRDMHGASFANLLAEIEI